MTFDRLARGAALAAACAMPTAVVAQGFGLNEVGSCAVARAAAVTGAPCADASTIYWNPAATISLPRWSAYVGAATIAVGGSFTSDVTAASYPGNVPVEVPPHAFLNYTTERRVALGFGVYVPYGLTSRWNDNFPGRFAALKASLQSIYFQPNVAWSTESGMFSVGGGPVFGYSSIELIQGVDLSQQTLTGPLTFGNIGIAPGTEFARARLTGDGTAWGAHVGAWVRLPLVQLGVRYLTEMKFTYDDAEARFDQITTGVILPRKNPISLATGDTVTVIPVDVVLRPQFAPGGALVTQKVRTEIKHPAQLQVGIGLGPYANTTLSADYHFVGWKSFDRLPIDFQGGATDRTLIEDYKNSSAARVGLEHKFTRGLLGTTIGNDWALRAGYSYVSTPAPDVTVTPLLPDQSRNNYSIGLGIPFARRYLFDVAYLKVDTNGRRGRIVERTSESQTAAQLNSGFYELNANIWSFSVRANF